jgi:tetratricopeptide (TPR) repeat protein
MIAKYLCTLAAGLILAGSTPGLPAPQASPKQAGGDAAPIRDTIETFRKLLLKQLQHGGSYVYTNNPHAAYDYFLHGYLPQTQVKPWVADYHVPAKELPQTNAALWGAYLGIPTPNQNTANVQPSYYQASNSNLNSAEGTYLPGHGVVMLGTLRTFTMRGMSQQLTCTKCHDDKVTPKEDAASPQNLADAEWDAVTGRPSAGPLPAKDKKASPKVTEFCQPSFLADQLVQLLARHGHRFDLKANERITIQLHIRGGASLAPPTTSDFQPNVNNIADGGTVAWRNYALKEYVPNSYINRLTTDAALALPSTAEQASQDPDPTNTFLRRQNAMADLHVKEGNYAKALEAFRSIIDSKHTLQYTDRADAYRRMAELLIRQGKIDEAQSILSKYNELLKANPTTQKPANTPAQSAGAKPTSDWSITVSATKAQCDAFRAGALKLEDFAKQVEIKTTK